VRDPSFESLRVIMDVGRASSHLRRCLRTRLEYYAVKLAFFETANPQWVLGISIWLAIGELARSRARQISMSPWIVVAIQSTSTPVDAVVHDGTFAGVDELNCGMVRFLFTCGGIAIVR
jgi:hypothetical protein